MNTPQSGILWLTPNMAVADVRSTMDWYTGALGFVPIMAVATDKPEMEMADIPADHPLQFAMLKRDNAEIMLQEIGNLTDDLPLPMSTTPGGCTLYIGVADVQAIYDGLAAYGAAPTDIRQTWYGNKETFVTDPNGYVLGFAEMVREPA